MAYSGELVKMSNGRWARFQQCVVGEDDPPLLVAVELEDKYQELLDATESSVEQFRKQGLPVHVQIDPAHSSGIRVSVSGREVH